MKSLINILIHILKFKMNKIAFVHFFTTLNKQIDKLLPSFFMYVYALNIYSLLHF